MWLKKEFGPITLLWQTAMTKNLEEKDGQTRVRQSVSA